MSSLADTSRSTFLDFRYFGFKTRNVVQHSGTTLLYWHLLPFTVLLFFFCVLNLILLYFTALYCTLLYFTDFFCTILYFTAIYYTLLLLYCYFTVIYCILSCLIAIYWPLLHFTVPPSISVLQGQQSASLEGNLPYSSIQSWEKQLFW